MSFLHGLSIQKDPLFIFSGPSGLAADPIVTLWMHIASDPFLEICNQWGRVESTSKYVILSGYVGSDIWILSVWVDMTTISFVEDCSTSKFLIHPSITNPNDSQKWNSIIKMDL